jgi:galactose mutarotase-like enzyme
MTGWSWRVWTVSNVTNSSVSFTFYDPGQSPLPHSINYSHHILADTDNLRLPIELVGGFPGSVLAELTYSLLPGGVWDIVLNANASSRTRKTSLSDP